MPGMQEPHHPIGHAADQREKYPSVLSAMQKNNACEY